MPLARGRLAVHPPGKVQRGPRWTDVAAIFFNSLWDGHICCPTMPIRTRFLAILEYLPYRKLMDLR